MLPSTELNFEQISVARSRPHHRHLVGHDRPGVRHAVGHRADAGPVGRVHRLRRPVAGSDAVVGEATGHVEEAEALVTEIEVQIQAVADEHPAWDGLEAAVAYVLTETEIGAYASGDTRPKLLEGARLRDAARVRRAGRRPVLQLVQLRGDRPRSTVTCCCGSRRTRRSTTQIKANPLRQQLTAVTRGPGDLPRPAAGRSVLVLQRAQPAVPLRHPRPPARGRRRRRPRHRGPAGITTAGRPCGGRARRCRLPAAAVPSRRRGCR